MTKYKVTNGNLVTEFQNEESANNYANENGGDVSSFEESAPSVSQKELDMIRFLKRAAIKSQIIAEIAADNMERVRAGTWTVPNLIALTQDAELKNLLGDIEALSFEIAYTKIDGLTSSLLTSDIKADWKAKLYSRFYL